MDLAKLHGHIIDKKAVFKVPSLAEMEESQLKQLVIEAQAAEAKEGED